MCSHFRKIHECKKSLEENLFILHPKLSLALLEIRGHCQADYESKLMLAIEVGTTYTLEEFRDCHMGKMGLVRCKQSFHTNHVQVRTCMYTYIHVYLVFSSLSVYSFVSLAYVCRYLEFCQSCTYK